jgi:hypothetical protein
MFFVAKMVRWFEPSPPARLAASPSSGRCTLLGFAIFSEQSASADLNDPRTVAGLR